MCFVVFSWLSLIISFVVVVVVVAGGLFFPYFLQVVVLNIQPTSCVSIVNLVVPVWSFVANLSFSP